MSKRLLAKGLTFVVAVSSFALAPALAQAKERLEPPPLWYSNHGLLGATHTPVIAWGQILLESGAVGKIECTNVMNLSVWNEVGHGFGQFEGWGTNACKAPQLEEILEKTYEGAIKEGLIKSPLSVFATSELPLRAELREGEVCKARTKTKLSECEAAEERLINEELTAVVPSGLHRRATSFPWKMEVYREIRNEEEVGVPQIGMAPEGKSCYPTEKVINSEGKEVERPVGWEKVPAGCVKIVVVCPQVPAEVVFYGSLEPAILNGVKNGLSPSRLEFGAAAGALVSSDGEAAETIIARELKIIGMNGSELITTQ